MVMLLGAPSTPPASSLGILLIVRETSTMIYERSEGNAGLLLVISRSRTYRFDFQSVPLDIYGAAESEMLSFLR